jgi:putative toxin-antitoxin system antitoxin component (TIGR02293 family)
VLKESVRGTPGTKGRKAAQVIHADVLLTVSARAGEVFHNRDKAVEWLREPSPALAGRTPLEAIGSPEGQAEVESLLGQIQHGIFA